MNATGRQRGFTVVETLVSTVLLVALGLATLALMSRFAHAVGDRTSSAGGEAAAETTLMSMRNDAATAFAVFVPAEDVFGNANAAAGAAGHEVDFYSKAEDGSEAWWAYVYDAGKGTVQRYDYQPSATGGGNLIGVVDRTSGVIDPNASYPPVTGVKAFSAHTLEASDLTTSANAFGPVIASLASSAGVTPVADPVGFVPTSNRARADLYGGNTTVEVSLTTSHGSHTFHLATTALPSGFTIHAAPAIRAFAYRMDYGHRFWFGFAQKTWARIFEQLQYSYTPAQSASWKVWCDFEVYGAGSNGLSLNDPNAVYRPHDWIEATAGTFYEVTQGNISSLNPNCTGNGKKIPGKNASLASPGPLAGAPDVIDTPPPCFLQGTCWPQGAPVDWAPPSPWPAQTPPPAWCVTHNLSTLCGGPGGPDTQIGPSAPPPDPSLTNYPTASPTSAPLSTPHPEPSAPPVHVGPILQ